MSYWKSKARGDAGEKFVKDDMKRLFPEAFIVDLAPSFPADLLMLDRVATENAKPRYDATWIEVKVLSKGIPKPTPSEAAFRQARLALGDGFASYHLRPNNGSFVIRSVV